MSLRIKVLLPLAVFSILLFFYLYGYWIPRSINADEADFQKTTESHLESVIEGLIPLLLGRQLDTVYENLDSLKDRNKEWLSIQLVGPEGKTRYPLRPLPLPTDIRTRHVHTVERSVNYLNMNLGTLIVVVDFTAHLDKMKKRHQELTATLLTVMIAFIVTIGLMLEWVVGRPVKLLAHASRKLAAGVFDVPLRKVGNDEVGTLVDSFASMRDAIQGYQAELLSRQVLLVKLFTAVEQSPVSIIITDAGGDIEFVNPKFTQITGYTFEEVLGKNPRILKSGETPPEEYKRLWETVTAGNVWHGVFHNRKKNGELFWEAAAISPIQNDEGTITNYLAIKEDITERKKLEEQLRHAQKMEAVGQLAGGIAHDFNNILTAIIGYGNIAIMKIPEGDPLRHYLGQMLAAAERAAALTKSLLAFSRKQIINPQPVSVNVIIERVGKLLHRSIGEDIELKIVLTEKDTTVLADSGQIEQVLINLAMNARDAMPNGGNLIIETGQAEIDDQYIKGHGYGKRGMYVLISITDSGEGMDEKIRERIFEPFFTTKEVGKGTGLGLSMVYGSIKQHNGFINVYSEPGRGTTFTIYLPLLKAGARPAAAGEPAPPPKGGTETILLAEDDTALRNLARGVLEEFGYSVIEAVDGQDAVEKFNMLKDRIQLLILDVIMPKKNGRETFEEAKKIKPGIKALFTSGYPAEIIQKKGILEADINFIIKPHPPQDFLRKIREVLDG
ncbi:MAG: hypothetical protein A2Z46_07800 [Nitrospirae bacterium RBG_19FT_COMBO_55_12]|nr:MAG: hypothetical protein A2Z46_07800 [Nitrospirae bacterium RBG_19FT_COMBO_55_12]